MVSIEFSGQVSARVRDAWNDAQLAELADSARRLHEARPRRGRGLEPLARVLRAAGDARAADAFFAEAAKGNLKVAKKHEASGEARSFRYRLFAANCYRLGGQARRFRKTVAPASRAAVERFELIASHGVLSAPDVQYLVEAFSGLLLAGNLTEAVDLARRPELPVAWEPVVAGVAAFVDGDGRALSHALDEWIERCANAPVNTEGVVVDDWDAAELLAQLEERLAG